MRGGCKIDFWEEEKEEEEEEVKTTTHKPCVGFIMCKCCPCDPCYDYYQRLKYDSSIMGRYSAFNLLKELKYTYTKGLSIKYNEDGWRLAGKCRKIIKPEYRFTKLPMELIKIICSFI